PHPPPLADRARRPGRRGVLPPQRALVPDHRRAVGTAVRDRAPAQDRRGSGERRDPHRRGALMDPRMLRYYSEELQYMRELGAEFAARFPKIAARLALDTTEVADPYVERLLEGFSFLSARVRLKLDSEFPRFAQHLLATVYPHYVAPTPAMAMVQ